MPETQTDPIIDELRAVRAVHAARFNQDVEAIFRDIEAPAGGLGARVRPRAAAPSGCCPGRSAQALTWALGPPTAPPPCSASLASARQWPTAGSPGWRGCARVFRTPRSMR